MFVYVLFWTGLRPSEAAGLQWQDLDLDRGRLHVRRSRSLWEYGDPKTDGARRTVELFPEAVWLLKMIQPLRVTPEMPVFTNTLGQPIEPNSLLQHWYACQRALGIRLRGLYCTKDTFVTTSLNAGVKIAWLEQQTGVAYATSAGTMGSGCRARARASSGASQPSIRGSSAAGKLCPRAGAVRTQSSQVAGKSSGAKCERGDLNPHGCLAHRILNPARLPIPPLSRGRTR